jgi:hypothetical protein
MQNYPEEQPRQNRGDKRRPRGSYDLSRRYDELYLRNRGNWDNPNSGTSMNNPDYSDEENWPPEGPFAGVGPRGYEPRDTDICSVVCERLAEHGRLNAADIEVSVENHEVTLSGTVDSRQSKRLAEQLAERVPGVNDVHNRLRLKPPE